MYLPRVDRVQHSVDRIADGVVDSVVQQWKGYDVLSMTHLSYSLGRRASKVANLLRLVFGFLKTLAWKHGARRSNHCHACSSELMQHLVSRPTINAAATCCLYFFPSG